MDELKNPAAFLRSNQRPNPKGVISINRKKPKIEKYSNEPPIFSYNFTIVDNNGQQLEMPPTEE